MSDSNGSITMYYDVISPYSYLALKILEQCRAVWNINVILTPVNLGGIMKASGNRPPIYVKAKGPWMALDLQRSGQEMGIRFNLPDGFPAVSTILAMRLLCAIDNPMDRWKATGLLFHSLLEEGQHLNDQVIRQSLSSIFDDSKITSLLTAANSPEVKQLLLDATQEALQLGGFGAPTLIVHRPGQSSQFFFGSDRFHQIAKVLGQSWPINSPLSKM